MKIFRSKWSKWEVLTMGTVNAKYFLLQSRKHENGKVQFRVEVSKEVYRSDIREAKDALYKMLS